MTRSRKLSHVLSVANTGDDSAISESEAATQPDLSEHVYRLTQSRAYIMLEISAKRPKQKVDKNDDRRRGLEETFPTLDAIAVTGPASTPCDDNHHWA